MISFIVAIILMLVLIVYARHDKRMNNKHRKVFDDVQNQMQEFTSLMKDSKLINGGKNVK